MRARGEEESVRTKVFAHAVEDMDKVLVDDASHLDRQDTNKGGSCVVLSRLEDGDGVDLVGEQVNLMLLAELHVLADGADGVTLPERVVRVAQDHTLDLDALDIRP